MKTQVQVLSDKSKLIDKALEVILEKIHTTLKKQDYFSFALSGGSTPKPLYEALATQNLPWSKIQIFWGDERYVPTDHPDSNLRMTKEAWLDKINIPATNIHPMPTDSDDPQIDADKYQATLSQVFSIPSYQFPVFDLILLGMGDDGHTASLFPHTPALNIRDRLIAVGNKDGQPRLTFTVSLINQAACVMFLVSGENKRPALKEIFAPSADNFSYPARFIQPQGELWWLLDQAAGAELNY